MFVEPKNSEQHVVNIEPKGRTDKLELVRPSPINTTLAVVPKPKTLKLTPTTLEHSTVTPMQITPAMFDVHEEHKPKEPTTREIATQTDALPPPTIVRLEIKVWSLVALDFVFAARVLLLLSCFSASCGLLCLVFNSCVCCVFVS